MENIEEARNEVVMNEGQEEIKELTNEKKKIHVLDMKEYEDFIPMLRKGPSLYEYEVKKKNKEHFCMTFSTSNRAGDLTAQEGDVVLKLPAKNIDSPIWRRDAIHAMGAGATYGADMLKKTYMVAVESVDWEKNEVILSAVLASQEAKEKLRNKITETLSNGERIQVPAEIVGPCPDSPSICLVNIAGIGIIGAIHIKDWSKAFTKTYDGVAVPGEYVTVVITGRMRWKGEMGIYRTEIFRCSRKLAITGDPWEGIEKRFPRGTNVRLTCISLEEKNFFATVKGLDEINAYCEYPDGEKFIKISIGKEYVGFVHRVSEEKHLLRIKILSEV